MKFYRQKQQTNEGKIKEFTPEEIDSFYQEGRCPRQNSDCAKKYCCNEHGKMPNETLCPVYARHEANLWNGDIWNGCDKETTKKIIYIWREGKYIVEDWDRIAEVGKDSLIGRVIIDLSKQKWPLAKKD